MLRVTILWVTLCLWYISADKPVVYLEPEKIVEILPQVMACISETGVNFEVLDKLRTGAVAGLKNDPNVPKFMYCGLRKAGIAKKNGHVDEDKLLHFFPSSADKAAIKQVVQECDKEGKDPVDTTFQFVKCFHTKMPMKVRF